jgi:hypothetical protein
VKPAGYCIKGSLYRVPWYGRVFSSPRSASKPLFRSPRRVAPVSAAAVTAVT